MLSNARTLVACSLLVLAPACSKGSNPGAPASSGDSAAPSAAAAQSSGPADPEFLGVYLRGADGALTALQEVQEQKKALPRPQIRNGMTFQQAQQILNTPTKYDLFFPSSPAIPAVDAQTLAGTGLLVHLEKFAALRLGALELRDVRLVELDKKHGFPGEEIAALPTKKIKDSLYQVLLGTPAAPLASGYYYAWIQATSDQKGFTSAFLLQVK